MLYYNRLNVVQYGTFEDMPSFTKWHRLKIIVFKTVVASRLGRLVNICEADMYCRLVQYDERPVPCVPF